MKLHVLISLRIHVLGMGLDMAVDDDEMWGIKNRKNVNVEGLNGNFLMRNGIEEF